MASSHRPAFAFYVAGALALAAALLGLFLALAGRDYRDSAESAARWQAAATALAGYERGLARAEGSQLAFLLTGSRDQSAARDGALAALERDEAALRRSLAHDPGAQPALAELARIGEATLAEWQRAAGARDLPGNGAWLPAATASAVPLESLRDRIDRAAAAAQAEARSLVPRFRILALLVPLLMFSGFAAFARWGLAESRTRQRLAEATERETEHDPVTGLPGRRLGQEWLAYSLAASKRTGDGVALLYVSVDNDGLPLRGEGLARELANRLQELKRESDLLARIDGSLFALVAQHVGDGPEVAALARRIHRALTDPPLPGAELAAHAVSVGVALYPDDADDPAGLVAAADSALLEARRSRSGIRFHREPSPVAAPSGAP